MICLAKPDTLWLITVNVLLGLAIVVCLVMIAMSFLNEIRRNRKEKREERQVPDDYLKGLKDLGVTLPDGGKKIDEMDEEEE
jgi:hypothetical protein